MTSPDGGEVQGTLALFCGARRNGACLAVRFRRDCDGPAGAAEPADGPVRPAAPPAAAVPLLCPCAGVGLLRIWAARRAGRRIASVDRPHSRRAECGIVFDPEAGAMFPKTCPSPFSANAPWPMISSQVGFLTRRSGGNLPAARRAAAGTLPQASPPTVGRAAASNGTGWFRPPAPCYAGPGPALCGTCARHLSGSRIVYFTWGSCLPGVGWSDQSLTTPIQRKGACFNLDEWMSCLLCTPW